MELLCTLAFLGGAEVTCAQQWPAYSYPSGPYPGYVQGYPGAYAYPGYYAAPQAWGWPAPGYYPSPQPPTRTPAPTRNQVKVPVATATPASSPARANAPQPQGDGIRSLPATLPEAPVSAPPITTVSGPGDTMPAWGASALPLPPRPVKEPMFRPAPIDPSNKPPDLLAKAGDWFAAGPFHDWFGSLGNEAFHRELKETFWINADYLLAWIRPGPLAAPLVTIGSTVDPRSGALGQPGTAVLFGDKINYSLISGARVEGGLFLDEDNRFSLELAGFLLPMTQVHFQVASDNTGNPLIARPFFNPVTGENERILVSVPSSLTGGGPPITGSTSINSWSELFGVEMNARYHVYGGRRFHFDSLAGLRFLDLTENLTIQDQRQLPETLTVLFQGSPVAGPATLGDQDRFGTANQFVGAQLGGRLGLEEDLYSISAYGKVAMGVTNQQIAIDGVSSAASAVGNQIVPGGILAQPSNIGHYTRTVFGVVPEVGVTLAYNVTRHVRVRGGYSFLLWNQVARPGGQIDPSVNAGQIPLSSAYGTVTGPPNPTFQLSESTFWVQAITCGLEFRY